MAYFTCPVCGASREVDDSLAGGTVLCKQCLARGEVAAPIPGQGVPIRFSCPFCRAGLEMPREDAGKKGPCPRCGQRLQVPGSPPGKTVLGHPIPPAASSGATDCKIRQAPRRQGRAGFSCPICGTRGAPIWRQRIGATSWIIAGSISSTLTTVSAVGFLLALGGLHNPCCLLFVLTPLSLLGLLAKESYRACANCGFRID